MPACAVQVLDHGFFKVLEVMGSDETICDSARMSYGRGTKPVQKIAGLINYLVRNHHTSPLEMGEIRFHIRMPIFVMRQWVRHRTANLNEYSGRYSEMVRLFYVPEKEQICLQDKVNKQGSAEPMSSMKAKGVQKVIKGMSEEAFDEYETLLSTGLSRETARIILPLNTYTEVVWKLDISNLIKFLWLRDDSHAQWEIRQYAKLVSNAVEKYFPLVFAAYQEARNSETFTQAEIQALITGDMSHLTGHSVIDRLTTLLENYQK
jgi:thymidylate synthase (FAD)